MTSHILWGCPNRHLRIINNQAHLPVQSRMLLHIKLIQPLFYEDNMWQPSC